VRVVYHPGVQRDVSAILRYYDGVSKKLGDDFWADFRAGVERAAEHPERCHALESGLRRFNLKRFPYHFLFRLRPDTMRITVVRHHKRHPRVGLSRR
jgi:toxin ParE1/3/4